MDLYVVGFLAMMTFMILVGIAACYFISTEKQGKPTEPPLYTNVKTIDTHTIETVDASGQAQRWNRVS
jgi:hypothetical protein